jgi:hexokinase
MAAPELPQVAAALQLRSLSGGAHPPPALADGPKTPLQQIVPQVLNIVPTAYSLLLSTARGLLHSVATSGAVKSAVSQFANRVVIGELGLPLKDIDTVVWSTWLASAGYTERPGWQKLATALQARAATMTAAEIAAVVEAFGTVGMYDKTLFTALATVRHPMAFISILMQHYYVSSRQDRMHCVYLGA